MLTEGQKSRNSRWFNWYRATKATSMTDKSAALLKEGLDKVCDKHDLVLPEMVEDLTKGIALDPPIGNYIDSMDRLMKILSTLSAMREAKLSDDDTIKSELQKQLNTWGNNHANLDVGAVEDYDRVRNLNSGLYNQISNGEWPQEGTYCEDNDITRVLKPLTQNTGGIRKAGRYLTNAIDLSKSADSLEDLLTNTVKQLSYHLILYADKADIKPVRGQDGELISNTIYLYQDGEDLHAVFLGKDLNLGDSQLKDMLEFPATGSTQINAGSDINAILGDICNAVAHACFEKYGSNPNEKNLKGQVELLTPINDGGGHWRLGNNQLESGNLSKSVLWDSYTDPTRSAVYANMMDAVTIFCVNQEQKEIPPVEGQCPAIQKNGWSCGDFVTRQALISGKFDLNKYPILIAIRDCPSDEPQRLRELMIKAVIQSDPELSNKLKKTNKSEAYIAAINAIRDCDPKDHKQLHELVKKAETANAPNDSKNDKNNSLDAHEVAQNVALNYLNRAYEYHLDQLEKSLGTKVQYKEEVAEKVDAARLIHDLNQLGQLIEGGYLDLEVLALESGERHAKIEKAMLQFAEDSDDLNTTELSQVETLPSHYLPLTNPASSSSDRETPQEALQGYLSNTFQALADDFQIAFLSRDFKTKGEVDAYLDAAMLNKSADFFVQLLKSGYLNKDEDVDIYLLQGTIFSVSEGERDKTLRDLAHKDSLAYIAANGKTALDLGEPSVQQTQDSAPSQGLR